jgi:hypothetical protein
MNVRYVYKLKTHNNILIIWNLRQKLKINHKDSERWLE